MGFFLALSRFVGPLQKLLPARRQSLVAIDLDESSVRAIHVRRDGTRLVLDGYRIVRIPAGTPSGALAAACRQALDLRLGDEAVAVSIASPEATVRKLDLPRMRPEELLEALPWEARRHIGGLADDALLDAQILGGTNNGEAIETVLVAFPKARYAEMELLWSDLGITPAFVDLRPLATMNSLFLRSADGDRSPFALLDLGAGVGSFSIFSRSSLILFRDVSPRLAHLDSLLASHFTIPAAEVEQFKMTGKLPNGKVATSQEIEEALADLVAELAEDLRAGVVYLENQTGGTLDKVYMAGGNSIFLDRHGAADAVRSQSGVTLERYNPFQTMRLGVVDEMALKAAYSELCAPAGLAARFFAAA